MADKIPLALNTPTGASAPRWAERIANRLPDVATLADELRSVQGQLDNYGPKPADERPRLLQQRTDLITKLRGDTRFQPAKDERTVLLEAQLLLGNEKWDATTAPAALVPLDAALVNLGGHLGEAGWSAKALLETIDSLLELRGQLAGMANSSSP